MDNKIREQLKKIDQAKIDLEIALDEARMREDDLYLEIKRLKRLLNKEVGKNG